MLKGMRTIDIMSLLGQRQLYRGKRFETEEWSSKEFMNRMEEGKASGKIKATRASKAAATVGM
jgi:hypothetical protein